MFPTPIEYMSTNSHDRDIVPIVAPTGFREYDVRWKFPEDINLLGVQAVGMAFGSYLHELGIEPKIVVGHDYRSYSTQVKTALSLGLVAAGCHVLDIGLCLSPIAYFAQFDLEAPAVAMVTASHNPNGWTGMKFGKEPPLTCDSHDIKTLQDITMSGKWKLRNGGSYKFIADESSRYISHITRNYNFSRKMRFVCACGNGTAGFFIPKTLAMTGVEVIPLHAAPDHSFPNYNPDPESPKMMEAMIQAAKEHKVDGVLGFDGDGDRCWVIDENGNPIYPDKMGLLLARKWAKNFPNAKFVTDVKSTSLFFSDPVLQSYGANTEYCKTGHSYMKRYIRDNSALAGFERSGHYVMGKPLGPGYDDAVTAALEICRLLDENQDKTLSWFSDSLPRTWSTPSISVNCGDNVKYNVIESVSDYITKNIESISVFEGRKIHEIITLNGIRVIFEKGAWFLIRASSNTPNLVVVCESPNSQNEMHVLLKFVRSLLGQHPEISDLSNIAE